MVSPLVMLLLFCVLFEPSAQLCSLVQASCLVQVACMRDADRLGMTRGRTTKTSSKTLTLTSTSDVATMQSMLYVVLHCEQLHATCHVMPDVVQ